MEVEREGRRMPFIITVKNILLKIFNLDAEMYAVRKMWQCACVLAYVYAKRIHS